MSGKEHNDFMHNLVGLIKNLGWSEKASKVYLAAWRLGEVTVQQLAKEAGLKRTTVYYVLDELIALGALIRTKKNKKTFYLPDTPANLLKRARERIERFQKSIGLLEEAKGNLFKKPRVYFLFGSIGFKQIWDKIFESKEKEYRIITQGENFLDFVKEKYILNEIIARKKKLKISSRQLISDSAYAREIVSKDQKENRASKILPPIFKLSFTTIITNEWVGFISPKFENMILVVENDSFAKTQRSLFEIIWNSIN